MDARSITIVVPVFNESESLETLLSEIHATAREHHLDVKTIFVDDGSTDASWSRIAAMADSDPTVAGVRFRRNAGKAAALMAGFAEARGDIVFMMDADLQDPPEEMPRMLAKLDEGFDLVSGWKQVRHDPWHKVYPSRVFNKMISRLTGVHLHDHVCGLKCMRREVAECLKLYGEFHRFIGVFAGARDYRVTEIPTLHRPRTTGVGKYGFTRFFKGFMDLITVVMLTRFRWRPQHLIGVTGLVIVVCNLLLIGLSNVVGWLFVSAARAGGDPSSFLTGVGWLMPLALLSGLLAILVPGITLVAIGLVAELIVANRPMEDLYEVTERVGWCVLARPEAPGAAT